MSLKNRLWAYAQDFVSFLIENLEEIDKIKCIILFGSVTRGAASSQSDVDIFIDTKFALESKINHIVEQFYDSVKFKKYWKLIGIQNTINCITSDLEKWELKRSIISEGLLLWGKYQAKPEAQGYTLFKINLLQKRAKQVALWRKLYGYKQKVGKIQYLSKGLVEECGGKKLAPGILVVPIAQTQKILAFLRQNKIHYQLIELWTDFKF